MPLVNVHTFRQAHSGSTARPTQAFRWKDNPAEDSAFAAAMEFPDLDRINMTVDRSGPTPVLRWEDSNGTPGSVEIGAVVGVRARLAGSGSAGTSHAVALPAAEVGDRLIVGFVNDDTTSNPSVASGWTQVGTTQDQGIGTNHSLSVWTRVATGSDSLTIDLSSSQEAQWVAVALVGDGGTPEFAFANGGSATTGAVTAITGLPSGDYDSVIFLGLDNGGAVAHTATPPAGWANLTADSGAATHAVLAYSMDETATGVTGLSPADVTWTNAEQWITAHVVVPAAGVLWHRSPGETGTGVPVAPGPLLPGYWECDQYGRPFDLNDLLA